MGLKKYEIITVGSGKRVRALRSWRVQDRYVNIGDVGGIVYDEKTLSQGGACWLFRGNFGFPGARIGGDSIVDVGEAAPDVTGSANLDILGTSTVVGSPVRFSSGQTAADAVVLTAADFEQGTFNHAAGSNWETWKQSSPNFLRTKAPIFMGGRGVTLKVGVPGYAVQAYVLDRDGLAIGSAFTVTGAGVTLAVPAGQYFLLALRKDPVANIVPADATAAQIKFTGTYETKLSIIDSRVEINPATSTGTTIIRPGGTYTFASGAKYPEAIIRNSKVSMSVPAVASRSYRIMGQIIESNATLDATAGDVSVAGQYSNIKNLMASGTITSNPGVTSYNVIQAYNCDNMVVNTTNFPGLAAIQTAGVPIKFYNCNLNNGRFYHHAQIANTYRDINFDLATKDLGKTFDTNRILVSSEVNGMYRAWSATDFGALIESYESVKGASLSNIADSYNTTVYADAYLNGRFDLRGTNVFGNSMKHEASNTQNVTVVQGGLTLTAGQPPAPSNSPNVVRTINPIRINSGNGFTVIAPTGIQARLVFIDAGGVYVTASGWLNGAANVPAANLTEYAAFITFQKSTGTAITPDDVKGVTVTTYNGCKLVNTKETAATIAGNVRVEDNATLIDTSVTGTGYFGGNSTAQGLAAEGLVYMKDRAVFAPTITGTPKANILRMTDNASFTGGWSGAGTRLTMSDNARYRSTTALNTLGVVGMYGNADISGSGSVSVSGVLVLKDNARINVGNASVSGDITLGGKYTQTAGKVWTGKRVIASQDAPTYDDNVKTKYDI